MVRALASRQCGSGSIPGPGVICHMWVAFDGGSRPFFEGFPRPPLTTSKFQFDQESEGHRFVRREAAM